MSNQQDQNPMNTINTILHIVDSHISELGATTVQLTHLCPNTTHIFQPTNTTIQFMYLRPHTTHLYQPTNFGVHNSQNMGRSHTFSKALTGWKVGTKREPTFAGESARRKTNKPIINLVLTEIQQQKDPITGKHSRGTLNTIVEAYIKSPTHG